MFWFEKFKIGLISELIKNNKSDLKNNELDIFTTQAINKINVALEKFRYNVIIAIFHEVYNFYIKVLEQKKNYSNLEKNFKQILIVMTPVVPHLTNECLKKMGIKENFEWPIIEKALLEKENKEIVIQINGKKRGNILINKNELEDDIVKKLKKMNSIEKYLKDKAIIKTIYIKNRLINIIVN